MSETGRGWKDEQRKALPGLEVAQDEARLSASEGGSGRSSLEQTASWPLCRGGGC